MRAYSFVSKVQISCRTIRLEKEKSVEEEKNVKTTEGDIEQKGGWNREEREWKIY